MQKLSLFYISGDDISLDNGPGINEREFVLALAAHDEIELQCFVPEPAYPHKLAALSGLHFIPRLQLKQLRVLYFQLALIRAVLGVSRTVRPDALLIRPLFLNIAPLILARRLGCPLFVKTLAGAALFTFATRSLGRRLSAMLALPTWKRMIATAAYVDTPSQTYSTWQEWKFDIAPGRLVVVPNGANVHRFRPMPREVARAAVGLPQNAKVIGYIGSFNYVRNLETLIPAVEQLARRYDVGQLLVVLGGPHSDAVQREVTRKGLEGYFLFPGRVPFEDVPTWINAFDATLDLMTIDLDDPHGAGQLRCAFAQKTPQYLANGRPVIVADCADNRYIERERLGWLVDIGSTSSLAQAMSSVLTLNNSEWEATCTRCSEYATRNLAVDVLVQKRVTLWQEALRMYRSHANAVPLH